MLKSNITDKDTIIVWLSYSQLWIHPSWCWSHTELSDDDYVLGVLRNGVFHYVEK